MLQIGLTGGIASGKSTVSRLFAQAGAVIIDSDALAREVVAAGTPGLAAVVAEFGPVLGPDGSLDRAALAQLVFSDDAARERLNAIVHPLVRSASDARVDAAPPDSIVVHDIPLLVETGLGRQFALVVVVDAPEPVRLERAVERGLTPEQARARLAAQASPEQRRSAADVWLDNSGTIESLERQVQDVWSRRLLPFAQQLHAGKASEGVARVSPVDVARLIERLQYAGAGTVSSADTTDGPLRLRAAATRELSARAMARIGFVPVGNDYGSADPARPVRLELDAPDVID